MKKILFSFLLFSVPAFASQSLDCQMLKNGRIVDRQVAPIATSTNVSEPILFLFGYGSIQGTVRDFFKNNSARHIELELSYKDGVSWGRGVSQIDYSPLLLGSVAQVSLEEPTFGTLFSIECFVVQIN